MRINFSGKDPRYPADVPHGLKIIALALLFGLFVMNGCASTGTRLAEASNPSPLVMGTAEGCLERSNAVFKDPDKAAQYCINHRSMEVDRDTTTAKFAGKVGVADAKADAKRACCGVYSGYPNMMYSGYSRGYFDPWTVGGNSRMATGADLRRSYPVLPPWE